MEYCITLGVLRGWWFFIGFPYVIYGWLNNKIAMKYMICRNNLLRFRQLNFNPTMNFISMYSRIYFTGEESQ